MASPSILVRRDYDDLSRAGADFVASVVAARPDAAVLIATGETPMGLYAELARRQQAGTFDGSRLRVFQLDEYAVIPDSDRRSLYAWTLKAFVDPLRIPHQRVVRLPVNGDIADGCAAYDRSVDDVGGIDLAILGIGVNGHVGFNEPPSDRWTTTRVVELAPETIRSNARYWGRREPVAHYGVTVGMTTLMNARRTLLLASGRRKREIVRRAMRGPISADVPASLLREADDVTVLVDRPAWDGAP
jgi:glucosamine-6-phosphate deaminase